MDSQHHITPLRVSYSTASPCQAPWTMYHPVHLFSFFAEPSTLSSTRRPQATPPTCRCTRVPTRQDPAGLYFVDSVPDRLSYPPLHVCSRTLTDCFSAFSLGSKRRRPFFGQSRQGMLGYRRQRNSEVGVVGWGRGVIERGWQEGGP
jgi:hypothetical protein